MTKTERHLVLDLETLGTKANSCILTIGALVFDPYKTDLIDYINNKSENSPDISILYKKISIDSCVDLGMTVDDETIKWWSKQNEAAIEEAFSDDDRHDIKDVLLELNKFSRNCTKFWAKSPSFDCNIIEDAASKLQIGVPWAYHQTRCIRTIEDFTDFKTAKINSHNALEDCFYEAASVQTFYSKFNEKI